MEKKLEEIASLAQRRGKIKANENFIFFSFLLLWVKGKPTAAFFHFSLGTNRFFKGHFGVEKLIFHRSPGENLLTH